MSTPGYRKRTIFVLLSLLLVRFWFGQTFELSGQEAYLWLQGHGNNLSPGYWERGPIVPLLVRIGTLFFGDTELGVRWLSAVIACLTGFILFYLARHWFNARAAFWTVLLFIFIPMYAWKLSFMTEATASIGLMALALLALCRAVETNRTGWWLLLGVAAGLGLLVALPNAFWLVGMVLYFAISPVRRARLGSPLPWCAVLLAILFLFPIALWWNGQQVADVRRAHFLNAWPLSHPFSLNQGFHFLWLEIFYLSLPFFALLAVILWHLRARLWDEPRYGLLLCLAVPGLLWLNLTAFFSEPRFELVPAFFLPLILLAGCYAARLTNIDHRTRWAFLAVYAFAALQSLQGLNPFYLESNSDGTGWRLARSSSGENVTGLYAGKRQISWRNFADQVQRLQTEQGATLLITDNPPVASALSFYLPRNPAVYVGDKAEGAADFGLWDLGADAATPNESALYLSQAEGAPPAEVQRHFAPIEKLDFPPLPDSDRSWNIWLCRNFDAAPAAPVPGGAPLLRENDPLPK